jgi:hypothetical protein
LAHNIPNGLPTLGALIVILKPLHSFRNSFLVVAGVLASLPASAALVELTTATVGPLGTSDSASNVGADITIDFPDVTLFPSLQYYLRFTAGSQATTGNNVAIDNVDLFDNLSSSVLSSNFNNHGSPDGASVFTGIVIGPRPV